MEDGKNGKTRKRGKTSQAVSRVFLRFRAFPFAFAEGRGVCTARRGPRDEGSVLVVPDLRRRFLVVRALRARGLLAVAFLALAAFGVASLGAFRVLLGAALLVGLGLHGVRGGRAEVLVELRDCVLVLELRQ